ncbi:MAG TPA: VOC family protein [Jiangellaceae bacterium]|nr:VOC family protein [Jiangellaceae bacterium]
MAIPVQVVIDASDPHLLARFWAAALGYEVEDHSAIIEGLLAAGQLPPEAVVQVESRNAFADVAACSDPDGAGPRVLIQAVPEAKSVKNRVHLDLHVGADHISAEVERLIGLGATQAWTSSDRGPYTVTMRDPEGNEFCVA